MAFPPTDKMSGPPPGSTPQGLSSMLPSPPEPSEQEGFGEAEAPEGGGGGGLKDVFDELQGTLDALASILPNQSEDIDNVKTQLMEILAKAISGGTSFEGRTGGGTLRSPSNPGFPV